MEASWHDPGAPRTQFVRDRLAETSWEDRQYIDDLMCLERCMVYGGGIRSSYIGRSLPVETAAIREEIKEGVYLATEEFHARKAAHHALENFRRQQAEARQRDLEEAQRRWWRSVGGREPALSDGEGGNRGGR